MWASSVRVLATLATVLGGCGSSEPPAPELLAIEPSRAPIGVTRDVRIHGRFALGLHLDFGEGDGSWVRADFRARLGNVPLEAVRYLDGETLTAVVPALDAEGALDLWVADPSGREATLAKAYEVTSACVTEIPGDGIDQDCDGLDACFGDRDGDGFGSEVLVLASPEGCERTGSASALGGDCDDDPDGCGTACQPGGIEACDGLDNDCDAATPDGSGDPLSNTPCDGPDFDACEDDAWTCVGGELVCSTGTHNGETIADGIDQDCDGTDACYADWDGDGSGAPGAWVLDNDLDCDNGSAPTSSNANDCDDGDPSVAQGTACDDGDPLCTTYDSCFGGVCRGVTADWLCLGGCTDGCALCRSDLCCFDQCTGGACSTCRPGCTCTYLCDAGTACALACAPDAVCGLLATDRNDATVSCTGAGCIMQCDDRGACAMTCAAGARCEMRCYGTRACILECDQESQCLMDCAAPQSCAAGVVVCNRACP